MITFTNLKQLPQIPFADYLEIPAYSHSFLKYNIAGVVPEIVPTDKMQLGTLVDAILTDGKEVNASDEQYGYALIIARNLAAKYPMLKAAKKQVPCTGVATYSGLQMPMKTLPDFLIPKLATIELKITSAKNHNALIEYMGYDNQCFIERSLAGVGKSYLLIYCTSTDTSIFLDRPCPTASDWLAGKIMEFGG